MTTGLAKKLTIIQGLAAGTEANLTQILDALHDGLLGQPRAAAYDSDPPSAEVWCDTHEQPVTACHRDDHYCTGTVITVKDPTGEAAMRPDHAATDRRRLIQAIGAAYTALIACDDIRRRWITGPATAAAADTNDVDDLWCTSCSRDGQFCEPVSPDHQRARLCRWCAAFKHANGMLPPVKLLERRHRGERITQRDIDRLPVKIGNP